MAWSQPIKQALETRRLHGQYRQRQVNEHADARSLRVDGHDYLNFSANDSLGLNHDPRIFSAWQSGWATRVLCCLSPALPLIRW